MNEFTPLSRSRCMEGFDMGTMRIFGGLTMLAVLPALAPISRAAGQERQIGGGVGITVFTGRDFRGSAQTFQRDVPVLRVHNLNDRINSVRIGAGEQWEVCEHDNFRGRCIVISGSESNLARNNWGNRISSMRRVRSAAGVIPPSMVPSTVVLFNLPNFRGGQSSFRTPVRNLAPARPATRSVTVGRGVWELCSRPDFGGNCMTIDRNTPRLGSTVSGFHVRSLRPVLRQPR